jgi:tetrahydromethanopterin:alpha-L-glutamate ligase
MKIWVAGLPGGWSGERMVAALSSVKVDTKLISLADCSHEILSGRVTCQGEDLCSLDALVVRKLGDPIDPLTPSRLNLLRTLERRGVKVFSSAAAIDEANDRYRMSLQLAEAGIPLPETIVTESLDEAVSLVERWGRVVVKPLLTSKGRGMQLLRRDDAYRLSLKHWNHRSTSPFYVQRYVEATSDIGVALLGNQIIGAYQRVAAPGAWQTTIREGGHYEPYAPDSTVAALAQRAAEPFGLDYTVVDLVRSDNEWLAYEVSAFGGFSGLWACGIDAAAKLAHYVLAHIGLPARMKHGRRR